MLSVNNGKVKAIKPGTAKVMVKSEKYNLSQSCEISVIEKNISVSQITILENEMVLEKGKTYTLNVEVDPSNASNKDVTWTSSDENVVIVSSTGVVKAVGEGTATITVTTSDGKKTDSVKVIVKKEIDVINVTGVSLNKNSMSMYINDSETLVATVSPSDASNKDVTWTSSDKNVVIVSSTGVVKAVGEGTATITVTTSDGKKTDSVKVIVKKEIDVINVTGVSLNKNSTSMYINDSETLVATVSPSNASNKDVTWTSSDENVVIVSSTGVVKAVGEGTATITVTTNNGKKVTCNVSVTGMDRIHFIGNSTAFTTFVNQSNEFGTSKGPSPSETILLESDGKFALIDTGLSNSDSLNPGRAKYILNYLKSLGATKLEFIIITHAHYDHMGGALNIINGIEVGKLYTKVYYGTDSSDAKRYNNLYDKTQSEGIFEKINTNYEGKELSLGDMRIKFFATKNLTYYSACSGQDENINSIVNYITVNGKKILLTGDMEKPTTTKCFESFNSSCSGSSIIECLIKNNSINNIDLLKLPHHGYGSCDINSSIVEKLAPKYIVITNWSTKVNYYYNGITNESGVKGGPIYSGSTSCQAKYFSNYSTSGGNKTAFYVDNNNVVFDFTNGNIQTYNNNVSFN